MRDLSTLVARNFRNISYKLEYVNALLRVKDLDMAAAQLEDAVRVEPLNRDCRLRLMDVYMDQKKWGLFDKVVTFAELHPRMQESIFFRQHAYELSAQARYTEALDKIREAIAMDGHNPSYARDFLIILLQAKDDEGVIKETDRLIEAGHTEWWVYQLRGVARYAEGKQVEAIEQIDKALEAADRDKDPEAYQVALNSLSEISVDEALKRIAGRAASNDRWRMQSASLHMQKLQWDAALKDLGPTLASRDKLLRSDRMSAVRFAAECYQASGRPKEAKAFYLEWLKEAPNDPAALNNIAYLLAEDMNDPQGASEFSKKAYDLGRKFNNADPMILDTHGWVQTLCGGDDADKGLTLLSNVVETNPDFLEARYHLGMALMKKKRASEALLQFTAASDLIKASEQKKTPVKPELKARVLDALDKLKQTAATGT